MRGSPGSREDGKYYKGSYTNTDGYPVEVIRLKCCGYIKAIPIRNRHEYVSSTYKSNCPCCNRLCPFFDNLRMPKDIEYIVPVIED